MLRKIRLTVAIITFTLITLLFLDFTGCIHQWFGWLAKVQFLPAVLALNLFVFFFLVILTVLLGRVYCSVICPLGVMQDIISWFAGKTKKNRFSYSPAKNGLRYGVLALFIVLIVAGVSSVAVLVAPYSAYGRIASSLFAPIYQLTNNGLAYLAERMDSYAFYSVDIWIRSVGVLIISILTFGILAFLAWKHGRTYCNTICPVGTVLGFISRYSIFKPVIDTSKCNGCGLCARRCKASCINPKNHQIDYSRCVTCFDCIENCKQGAIKYVSRKKDTVSNGLNEEQTDKSRRSFLSITGIMATAVAAKAQSGVNMDGGLAEIKNKVNPERTTRLVPPGALSIRKFSAHCTACQLCVSVCPNQILRPSTDLMKFMQPEMDYLRGYCRPECVKCSEVCPTGAISLITTADKSATQIGHAIWVKERCVVNTDEVNCGNCERHCPTKAITLAPKDPNDPKSLKVPVINTELCIGCGACEYHCPSRPLSAIFVDGHERHRII